MVSIMGPVQHLAALPPSEELSNETDLGRLISQVKECLPVELQNMISQHLSGLFRCLGNCLLTLSHVMGPTRPHDPGQPGCVFRPLLNCQLFDRLGAHTVNVLGETCLARIGSDVPVDYDHVIALEYQDVTGVQVAFGRYGIVALRVLYIDGSTSPWLGGSQKKRFITCRGNDLRLLQAVSDVCADVKTQHLTFRRVKRANRDIGPQVNSVGHGA